MSYTIFNVTPEGDLKITLTEEGRQELIEMLESQTQTDEDIFLSLIESQLCNGYHTVLPEHIGALTDSIILANGIVDLDTSAEAEIDVWWFPDYQVKSYTEDLLNNGEVTFTNAESFSVKM